MTKAHTELLFVNSPIKGKPETYFLAGKQDILNYQNFRVRHLKLASLRYWQIARMEVIWESPLKVFGKGQKQVCRRRIILSKFLDCRESKRTNVVKRRFSRHFETSLI